MRVEARPAGTQTRPTFPGTLPLRKAGEVRAPVVACPHTLVPPAHLLVRGPGLVAIGLEGGVGRLEGRLVCQLQRLRPLQHASVIECGLVACARGCVRGGTSGRERAPLDSSAAQVHNVWVRRVQMVGLKDTVATGHVRKWLLHSTAPQPQLHQGERTAQPPLPRTARHHHMQRACVSFGSRLQLHQVVRAHRLGRPASPVGGVRAGVVGLQERKVQGRDARVRERERVPACMCRRATLWECTGGMHVRAHARLPTCTLKYGSSSSGSGCRRGSCRARAAHRKRRARTQALAGRARARSTRCEASGAGAAAACAPAAARCPPFRQTGAARRAC